jgi:hypothetical protein
LETDLTVFFDGTPVTRFRNPKLARIAEQVHEQRNARILHEQPAPHDTLTLTIGDNQQLGVSKSDSAYVSEYAQASCPGADTIMEVVRALLQWDIYYLKR